MWNSKSFLFEDLYCQSVVEGDARLRLVDWPPYCCGWEGRHTIYAKILSFDTLAATSNKGYVKTHRVAMHLNEQFHTSKQHCKRFKSKTYQESKKRERDRKLKKSSDQEDENQEHKLDFRAIHIKHNGSKPAKSHKQKPTFLQMVTTLNDEIEKLVSNHKHPEKVDYLSIIVD